MIAYLTTIGERTTDICLEQLDRFGFKTAVLSRDETWPEKYKRFLDLASKENEVVMRIDADVILNKNILPVVQSIEKIGIPSWLMAQGKVFDLYQNDILTGQPVFYTPKAIEIIRKEFASVLALRPETWAWRLPEINGYTYSYPEILGMHGFFQDEQTVERAIGNKASRGQMERYDFGLVKKLMKL